MSQQLSRIKKGMGGYIIWAILLPAKEHRVLQTNCCTHAEEHDFATESLERVAAGH